MGNASEQPKDGQDLLWKALKSDPVSLNASGSRELVLRLCSGLTATEPPRAPGPDAIRALKHPVNFKILIQEGADSITAPMAARSLLHLGPEYLERARRALLGRKHHEATARWTEITRQIYGSLSEPEVRMDAITHLIDRDLHGTWTFHREPRDSRSGIWSTHPEPGDVYSHPYISRRNWRDPDIVPMLNALGRARLRGTIPENYLSDLITGNLLSVALDRDNGGPGTLLQIAVRRITDAGDLRTALDQESGYATHQSQDHPLFFGLRSTRLLDGLLKIHHGAYPNRVTQGLPQELWPALLDLIAYHECDWDRLVTDDAEKGGPERLERIQQMAADFKTHAIRTAVKNRGEGNHGGSEMPRIADMRENKNRATALRITGEKTSGKNQAPGMKPT